MIRPGRLVVRYVVPERVTAPGQLRRCREFLSSGELARLARFRRAADRQRFLISHALVRSSLSEQSQVHPADWRFAAGAQGRPEVVAPDEGAAIRFSLSHTRGMSVCAVTASDDVGIDVESASRRGDFEAIARRMLSREEVERLSRLEDGLRQIAFLRHWTLREAWVKARGEGMLRVPRDAVAFRIGEADGEGIEADFAPDLAEESGSWRFFSRELERTHLCAVAVRQRATSPVTLIVGPSDSIQPSGSSSSSV